MIPVIYILRSQLSKNAQQGSNLAHCIVADLLSAIFFENLQHQGILQMCMLQPPAIAEHHAQLETATCTSVKCPDAEDFQIATAHAILHYYTSNVLLRIAMLCSNALQSSIVSLQQHVKSTRLIGKLHKPIGWHAQT